MNNKELNKQELKDLKKWLTADIVDDPEDLFEEIDTIITLIDFWLEHNK